MTADNLNNVFRLAEPATMKINVSRNDWHIGGKSQIRKEGSNLKMRTELVAAGAVPECNTMYDCGVKMARSELKSLINGLSFQSRRGEHRPHSEHGLRVGRSAERGGRVKKVIVTIDSTLRQKSGSPMDLDFSNGKSYTKGRGFDMEPKIFELRCSYDVKGNTGSPKEMQSITTFGNDVSDRDTIIK